MSAERPTAWQRVGRAILWLWWGGTSKPGPAWLLAFGLAMGFIIGVLFHMNFGTFVEQVRFTVFGPPAIPKPGPPPPASMAWVQVKTTGYCGCEICCPGTSDHKTAINRDLRQFPYGIAVDPQLIPYRTNLFVPGYGYAMVDDTGGAMRQSAKKNIIHLDLRFPDHKTARRWGVRWMWIAVPADSGAARMEQMHEQEQAR